MTNDLGLLGVGGGVTRPDWLGKPTNRKQRGEGDTPQAAPVPAGSEVDVRDQRLVKESVQKLASQTEGYEQTYDMPSVAANTTTNLDITVTAPDKVRAGDYVVYLGGATLNHGIVSQAAGMVSPSNDVIRVRVSNVTAADIDPASMTHYFLIFRSVSSA